MPTLTFYKDTPSATNEGKIHFEGSFHVEQVYPCDSVSMVPVEIKIPDSFWVGLKECDSGRVVDMDRALNEPPPES
jgi:hypothetical protein